MSLAGRATRGAAIAFLALAGPALVPSGVRAQQPAPPEQVELADAEVQVTPRSAFLRSLVLPGWGHVVTGSFGRGGFYVTAQSASLWMVWKSMHRRNEARRLGDVERAVARERVLLGGTTEPVEIARQIEADLGVQAWQSLIDARSQQVEDWTAFSLFLVLVGAADAYVAAHLLDFPERLSTRLLPLSIPDRLSFRLIPAELGEGLDLKFSVQVPPLR